MTDTVLKPFEIKHYSTYTQMKAGLAEIYVRWIMTRIAKLWHQHKDHVWYKYLASVANNHNSTAHLITKVKPKDVDESNSPEVRNQGHLLSQIFHNFVFLIRFFDASMTH